MARKKRPGHTAEKSYPLAMVTEMERIAALCGRASVLLATADVASRSWRRDLIGTAQGFDGQLQSLIGITPLAVLQQEHNGLITAVRNVTDAVYDLAREACKDEPDADAVAALMMKIDAVAGEISAAIVALSQKAKGLTEQLRGQADLQA